MFIKDIVNGLREKFKLLKEDKNSYLVKKEKEKINKFKQKIFTPIIKRLFVLLCIIIISFISYSIYCYLNDRTFTENDRINELSLRRKIIASPDNLSKILNLLQLTKKNNIKQYLVIVRGSTKTESINILSDKETRSICYRPWITHPGGQLPYHAPACVKNGLTYISEEYLYSNPTVLAHEMAHLYLGEKNQITIYYYIIIGANPLFHPLMAFTQDRGMNVDVVEAGVDYLADRNILKTDLKVLDLYYKQPLFILKSLKVILIYQMKLLLLLIWPLITVVPAFISAIIMTILNYDLDRYWHIKTFFIMNQYALYFYSMILVILMWDKVINLVQKINEKLFKK